MLQAQSQHAVRSVHERGFCAAAWQPEVVALAAPLRVPQGTYVLNLSVSTAESIEAIVNQLAEPLVGLLRLRAQIT